MKPKKPPFKIVWTFDDGTGSDYHDWAPYLAKVKGKATFYVATSWIGTKGHTTRDQLIELEGLGHEIGSHSVTHPDLVKLLATDPKACEREIRESRESLLSWGLKITSFAYPHGPHNAAVEALVRAAGYTNARCSEWINWRGKEVEGLPPANPFAWRTMGCTGLDTTVAGLKEAALASRDAGGSFLGILSHAAGNDPKAPGYYTHPKVATDFLQWASGEGFVFSTVRDALGI